MWGQFFHGFGFPSSKEPNQNLQRRISRLFETKNKPKDFSPTLQELQNQKNKVRRLSSVYEENIAAYNENNSMQSSMIEKKPFVGKLSLMPPKDSSPTGLTLFPPRKLSPILRLSPSEVLFAIPKVEPPKRRCVKNAILYLIKIDTEYIENMKKLTTTYVKYFENLPALRLRNEAAITDRQKRELFGPIEDILELHEKKVHPMLVACVNNVIWLAKKHSKMCSDGRFNCYIVHAMDEKDCEHRRAVYYRSFMDEIYRKCAFPFEFLPIQQLARYHLVIIDILKELENTKAPPKQIEAVCKAESDMKNLMEKIYAMRQLSKNNL